MSHTHGARVPSFARIIWSCSTGTNHYAILPAANRGRSRRPDSPVLRLRPRLSSLQTHARFIIFLHLLLRMCEKMFLMANWPPNPPLHVHT